MDLLNENMINILEDTRANIAPTRNPRFYHTRRVGSVPVVSPNFYSPSKVPRKPRSMFKMPELSSNSSDQQNVQPSPLTAAISALQGVPRSRYSSEALQAFATTAIAQNTIPCRSAFAPVPPSILNDSSDFLGPDYNNNNTSVQKSGPQLKSKLPQGNTLRNHQHDSVFLNHAIRMGTPESPDDVNPLSDEIRKMQIIAWQSAVVKQADAVFSAMKTASDLKSLIGAVISDVKSLPDGYAPRANGSMSSYFMEMATRLIKCADDCVAMSTELYAHGA